jgi:hypothetical protein
VLWLKTGRNTLGLGCNHTNYPHLLITYQAPIVYRELCKSETLSGTSPIPLYFVVEILQGRVIFTILQKSRWEDWGWDTVKAACLRSHSCCIGFHTVFSGNWSLSETWEKPGPLPVFEVPGLLIDVLWRKSDHIILNIHVDQMTTSKPMKKAFRWLNLFIVN